MPKSNDTRFMNRPTCMQTDDPALAATLCTAALNRAARARAAYLDALFALGHDIDPASIAAEFDAMHFDADRNPITDEQASGLIERHTWAEKKRPQAFALMEEFADWHAYHAAQRSKN